MTRRRGDRPIPSYAEFIREQTSDLRCRKTRFGPIVVWVVDTYGSTEAALAENFSPVIVLWGSETRARRRAHRRWRSHVNRVRTDLRRGVEDVTEAVYRYARSPRHD